MSGTETAYDPTPPYAMSVLRIHEGMSVTEIAYGPTSPYAMSGTEIAYAASRMHHASQTAGEFPCRNQMQ
eukprot:2209205-Rhodomonas_salina.2